MATVAVALIGAATYVLGELLSPDGSLVVLAALTACACAAALARRHPLGPGPAALLALGAIALAALDWWLVTGEAVLALGRAVLGLQFVRLWAPLQARERWQVLVLSLTHVAAASVLTVDILFPVCLAAYAVAGTSTLVLGHLHAEAAACGAPPPRVTARALAGIGLLSVIAMLLTAAIFLVVPRMGAGILQLDTGRRAVKVAGFGDTVRIGDLGEILQGSDTVMTVTFPEGGDGPETRFRGQIFETAGRDGDGRYRWTAPAHRVPGRQVGIDVTPTTTPSLFVAHHATLVPALRTRTSVRGARPAEHEIRLAPRSSAAPFAAAAPLAFQFRRPGLVPDQILVDPDGSVVELSRNSRTGAEDVQYTVTAWTIPGSGFCAPAPGPARAATVEACRAMPAGMAPALLERLRATAEDWASGATEPLDAAEAIERRLRDRGDYGYTLDQPDPAGGDPVEHFLYEARAGHCEYFAASMVLLCRALGHPARLVTGFLGGEQNAVGGFRNVRQSDAHAWVEVLSREGVWQTFDPTPRADESAGTLRFVRQVFDWLRFRWYSGVVDYDVQDQRRVFESGVRRLRDWGAALRHAPGSFSRAARDWRGGVGLALVGVGVWLVYGRRRRAARVARPGLAFYDELLRWLAHRGLPRVAAQTPCELLAAAAGAGVADGPLRELTDLFCRVRYGGRALDGAARAQAASALAALRAAGNGKPP